MYIFIWGSLSTIGESLCYASGLASLLGQFASLPVCSLWSHPSAAQRHFRKKEILKKGLSIFSTTLEIFYSKSLTFGQ
jgi:hypothetical protein